MCPMLWSMLGVQRHNMAQTPFRVSERQTLCRHCLMWQVQDREAQVWGSMEVALVLWGQSVQRGGPNGEMPEQTMGCPIYCKGQWAVLPSSMRARAP